MMSFTFYKQLNAMDCGPTCLRMIAKYYGKHYNAETLRQKTGFSRQGTSLLGISEAAETIAFRTRGMMLTLGKLLEAPMPCVLHWDQNHFVVLIKITKKKAKVADPAKGIVTYDMEDFLSHWISSERNGIHYGIALLLEPTPAFYKAEDEKERKLSWQMIMQYLRQSRGQIVQVIIALIVSSLFQLAFPFLTQSIVDTGINTQNLRFIVIVLIAQLMLTFSQTIVNFIRSRLLLRISNILNLQILSDFWIKLMRLPVSYFDAHQTGDTLQRINDHNTIQKFLTGSALSTLFSFFNFAVYAAVLIMYNIQLFFVFVVGSLIYFAWIQLFLKMRRKINYQVFHLASKENSATLQLIQGMQEIRLNNAGRLKRWDWENLQASVFKLQFKNLNYSQWQSAGGTFINQVQNIIISFIVARLVIDGQLTLGAMLAVQYIIGQLSGPISQWVEFIQSAQDAKISMERLNEIHQLPDEQDQGKTYTNRLPENKSISIQDLTFAYPGAMSELVLEDINLYIPEGKVTAIVGMSGSGKSTLLKILMKVYQHYGGKIRIGTEESGRELRKKDMDGLRFEYIDHDCWRDQIGAVMQEGYIFNDSIARNIAVGQEHVEFERLVHSSRIANIISFVESLPNGFYTQLGVEGVGLSQGQKQRILIARAVYKNPEYLFFDEATNALDSNNERDIVQNLENFFEGKTVVVVAHRLSTVKKADKIVVMEKGRIVEEGTHAYLTSIQGKYYELVKNQLEMGV